MKQKMIRLLSLIISVLLIVSAFAGCKENGKSETESYINNSTEAYIGIDGKFTDEKLTDFDSVAEALKESGDDLGYENAFDDLESKTENTVEDITYYRMQQTYEDYPVYGKTAVVMVDGDGKALGLTGNAQDITNPDMTKSVTLETAKQKILEYINNDLGYPSVSDIEINELLEESLYIYQKDAISTLAYAIDVNFGENAYEFVVSAKDGKILFNKCLIQTQNTVASGKNLQGETVSFNTWKENDTTYWLYDEERNITIYSADNKQLYSGYEIVYNSKKYFGTNYTDNDYTYKIFCDEKGKLVKDNNLSFELVKKVYSGDYNYFGFVDNIDNLHKPLNSVKNNSTEWNNSKAITYANQASVTYDYFNTYFKREGFDGKKSHLPIYFDDYLGGTVNAYSTGVGSNSLLSFSTTVGNSIDVLAHEFMHSVEQSESTMNYEGESGAIMEGYSDIFGELVQDYSDNKKLDNSSCDWLSQFRNYIEPITDGSPEVYKGKNWKSTSDNYDHGNVHHNSTVISHIAYEMATDEKHPLSADKLSNLWYSTMLTLPADCTFLGLRNNMEAVAKNLKLSEEEQEVISTAFTEANIGEAKVADSDYQAISTNFDLTVLDINNSPYNDYSVDIKGRSSNYSRHIDVKNDEPVEISLSEGKYSITVTDLKDTSKTVVKYIEAKTSGSSTLKIPTEFGVAAIPLTSFNMISDTIITIGEIYAIEPDILPLNANGFTIKWTSSDESVATVSPTGEAGIVTALSKGTTTITAEVNTGSEVITKTTNVRVASKARDTVLVLDISGSMSGKPLEEMKKSAIQFCNDLLTDEYNNRVGLVFYDDQITTVDLSSDLDMLIDRIENVSDGGTTNMEGGLAAADAMLKNGSKDGTIKNVVIMADGLPNKGNTSDSGSMPSGSYSGYYTSVSYANAVIDTAKDMMNRYNMYSLGFFHGLYSDEKDFATALMKELTNKTDGYHQVEQAENLQFAFGDISEDISLGSKIIINIACPVDVEVTYNGEMLSSAPDKYTDKSSFGTLTLLGKNKDIKVLSLDSDKTYDVKIVGTGEGKMDYSINYLDEKEMIADYRSFEAVPITSSTVIHSNTDNTVEDVSLNIDKDGDGIVDIIMAAAAKSKGQIIKGEENIEEPVAEEPEPQEPVVEEEKSYGWVVALVSVLSFMIVGGCIIIVVFINKNNAKTEELIAANIPDSQPNTNEHYEKKEYPVTDDMVRVSGVIQITNGSMNGFSVPIKDGQTLYLGKDPKVANIVFTNDYVNVSRMHCSITFDAERGKYYVVDTSRNGTYFIGKKRLEKGKRTPVSINTVLLLANEQCTILLG